MFLLLDLSATRVCILTAVGVIYSVVKDILGFERVRVESESSWRGFLSRLMERGLMPTELDLVISDEHKGLLASASEVLGDVPHQLCWAHRICDVRKSVLASERKEVVADLGMIYRAEHLAAAKDAFRRE